MLTLVRSIIEDSSLPKNPDWEISAAILERLIAKSDIALLKAQETSLEDAIRTKWLKFKDSHLKKRRKKILKARLFLF